VKRHLIFWKYLKTWLLVDITSSVPMDLLEMTILDKGSKGHLLKLAKLPRLYRLLRIARLFRVIRIFRRMTLINKIKEKLNLSIGAQRMI
jgi:hypothetical protein